MRLANPATQFKNIYNETFCFNSFLKCNSLGMHDFLQKIYPMSNDCLITYKNYKTFIPRLIKVLDFSIHALLIFKQNNLKAFDAHIGDTACQIRACIIIHLHKHIYHYCDLDYEIKCLKKLKNKLNEISLTINNATLFPATLLKNLLNQQQVPIYFSHITAFLTGCYFLCRYAWRDDEKITQSIDFTYFKESFNESSRFVSELTHRLQLYISTLSCEFVSCVAAYIFDDPKFYAIIKNLTYKSDKNRKVLPAYVSSYFINQFLIKERHPVLLKIWSTHSEQNIFFEFQDNKYIPNLLPMKKKRAYFVVYGTSKNNMSHTEFKNNIAFYMSNLSLLDFNFAIHKQFPGRKLQEQESLFCSKNRSINPLPKQLFEHFHDSLNLAKFLGCSIENSSFFLGKHVYSDFI